MPVEVLLAVPETAPTVADQATAILEESGDLRLVTRVGSGNDVAPVLADRAVDVIVFHEELGPVPVLDLARDVNRRFPDVSLILLAEEQTPELLRSAMAAGMRATVTVPLSLEEFAGAVSAAGEWSQSVRDRMSRSEGGAGQGRPGMMLTLAGAKGGVGTTTVATLVSLHLARTRSDTSVCLVDLDLQTGDVRALLDLTHRRSVVDLVPVAGELTTRHLDEALFLHRSGLSVLLPPVEGEMGEDVGSAAAQRILGGLRARFDVLIVDAGATMTEAAATAVEMADHALVVTSADVLSLRGANRLVALWDRLAVRRGGAHALVTRVSRDSEVQPELCRRVLDVPVLRTTVPARFRELEGAANTGSPDRVGDRIRDAVTRLTTELDDLEQTPDEDDTGLTSDEALADRVSAGGSGQSTVEFVAALPLVALALLLAWQLVLTGWTHVLTQNAAREGARQLSVSPAVDEDGDGVWDDVAASARRRIPASWDGLDVRQQGTQVTVAVDVPVILPGVGRLTAISSTAGAVRE